MKDCIKSLIGLDDIVAFVKKTCNSSEVYRRYNLRPSNLLIQLDAGNGQTTICKFIADNYAKSQVRSFKSIDLFLEYTLDGSLRQLENMFRDINAHAIYSNEYEGIVSIDISNLAEHLNEAQISYFFTNVKKTAKNSTLIFFVPSKTTKSMKCLVDQLRASVGDFKMFSAKVYTADELASIAASHIEDMDITFENKKAVQLMVKKDIQEKKITTARVACEMAQYYLKNDLIS